MNQRSQQAQGYEDHVKKQISSGLNIRKYCEAKKLNYHTFSYYRKKSKEASSSSSGFIQAKVKSNQDLSTGSFLPSVPPVGVDPIWLGQFVKSVWGLP